MAIQNFKNGIRSGSCIWYFEDGAISAQSNYYMDKEVGEIFRYYPNKKLKDYLVTDFDGNLQFGIAYSDTTGLINHIGGKGIADISINKDHFNVGDTLRAIFLLATPPDSEYRFYLNEDVSAPESKKEISIDETGSLVRYERISNSPGVYRWGGHLYIKFKDGKEETYPFDGNSTVE